MTEGISEVLGNSYLVLYSPSYLKRKLYSFMFEIFQSSLVPVLVYNSRLDE